MKDIVLGQREVGPEHPVYIIAEMSANHGGDLQRARDIVYAAKESRADAVKVQTFSAETHTIDCDKDCFVVKGGSPWDGRTLFDLYREAAMPWEWQAELKELTESLGLDFFSAAVDATSVEFLEGLNVPMHKASSFELVDLSLIEKMASTGKPLLLSTGMASTSEIQEAVDTARNAGTGEIGLFKCTSAYPANPLDMHLHTIRDMQERYDVPVGLSDHTMGFAVPVAAVALGACMIEKHFTLSRTLPGPDSSFSMEPEDFRQMVDAVRLVEPALGAVHYGPAENEASSKVFRRSLFVVDNIKAGEAFTIQNLRSIRPGNGLPPKYITHVLGKTAAVNIERGTPLTWPLVVQGEG